jgi:hypothetical protein
VAVMVTSHARSRAKSCRVLRRGLLVAAKILGVTGDRFGDYLSMQLRAVTWASKCGTIPLTFFFAAGGASCHSSR